MHYLAAVYTIAAAFGALLATIHFLIWRRDPKDKTFLLAATMSASASLAAVFELKLLSSTTIASSQGLFLWMNLWVAILLVAMVWFVRYRLKSGRRWLAISITAAWCAGLVVNFASPGNLTYVSLESVDSAQTAWGEVFAIVRGTPHPFKIVVDLASLAIMVFVLDASITASRKGMKRNAVMTGGSIFLFILFAGIHTPLVDAGIVNTPSLISVAFVAITVALALNLVDEVAKSHATLHQLDVARRRWTSLLENVELAVARIDRHGKIAYVNPFFQRLVGKDPDELVGKDAVGLLSPNLAEVSMLDLSRPQERGVRSNVLRQIVSADGEAHDVAWFSVELQDENGDYDGLISFGEDRTEQRKTQEELSDLQKGMEKLTTAVMLGELASSFAHELSQPIAAVLSNAQTMEILRFRSGQPEDETDEILADILHDTRRARDLMDRVRELMFNDTLTRERFDLLDAISEVLKMVRHELSEKDTEISVRPEVGPIWVDASRLEMQQVALNLILNAMQAMVTANTTERHITLSVVPSADTRVDLICDDTGPGLDPGVGEAIFKPFVSSKEKGNGIGLAVARRIVERHDGSIEIGRNEAGGARFILSMKIGLREADVA